MSYHTTRTYLGGNCSPLASEVKEGIYFCTSIQILYVYKPPTEENLSDGV